jgi:hypothetical protein
VDWLHHLRMAAGDLMKYDLAADVGFPSSRSGRRIVLDRREE